MLILPVNSKKFKEDLGRASMALNEFMTSPAQVVCDKCGWQGVDEDCIRVPDSLIECPKCREVVHLLVEDDPVIVGVTKTPKVS